MGNRWGNIPIIDRFMRLVDENGAIPHHRPELGPCWLWKGCKNTPKWQYGQFRISGRTILAHRFIYEAIHGKLQEGIHTLHRCDNPPCVRPSHLFAGTQKENLADMLLKGRSHGKAKLTLADVLEIRRLHEIGFNDRQIAEKYSVHTSNVNYIVRGITWAWL